MRFAEPPRAVFLASVPPGSTNASGSANPVPFWGAAAEKLGGMQRVRIGLTGLAFVFVLVMLAAIFTNPSNEQPITANMIEQQMMPGEQPNLLEAEPKEPLAELGVAPGNADSNKNVEPARAGAGR